MYYGAFPCITCLTCITFEVDVHYAIYLCNIHINSYIYLETSKIFFFILKRKNASISYVTAINLVQMFMTIHERNAATSTVIGWGSILNDIVSVILL